MNKDRSRQAALEFQDYLISKGLMATNTVRARKAALSKVLGILAEEEARDVTDLDINELMVRFSNLQGKGYTPGSLNTYKSRVKAALDDFESYLDNPLGFKPSVSPRQRTQKNDKGNSGAKLKAQPSSEAPSGKHTAPVFDTTNILPIPLRSDLTIRIQGIPFDLTEAEAKRIANVVLALANPEK